jgi:hypothetical protein
MLMREDEEGNRENFFIKRVGGAIELMGFWTEFWVERGSML